MKELTQTVTASAENAFLGNCWQTCVACLLDLDSIDALPSQIEHERPKPRADGSMGSGYYLGALNAYLRRHHGLAYVELHEPPELLARFRIVDPGWHMMTGTTVRSASLNGARHVVVARHGELAWDPHPSRAGLLGDVQWAFLVPFPKRWESSSWNNYACVCPACASGSTP